MDRINLFDETEFDLEEIKKCIDVYSQSTGISSFVIDDSGKTIYHALEGQCHNFCSMINNCSQNLYNCNDVHLWKHLLNDSVVSIFLVPWIDPLASPLIVEVL